MTERSPRALTEPLAWHYSPAKNKEKSRLQAEINNLFTPQKPLTVSDFGAFVNKMLKLQSGSRNLADTAKDSTPFILRESDSTVVFKHREKGTTITNTIDIRIPLDDQTDVVISVGAVTELNKPIPLFRRQPKLTGITYFKNTFSIVGRDQQLPADPTEELHREDIDTQEVTKAIALRLGIDVPDSTKDLMTLLETPLTKAQKLHNK